MSARQSGSFFLKCLPANDALVPHGSLTPAPAGLQFFVHPQAAIEPEALVIGRLHHAVLEVGDGVDAFFPAPFDADLVGFLIQFILILEEPDSRHAAQESGERASVTVG